MLAGVNSVNNRTFDLIAEFPKLFDKLGMMPDVFSMSLRGSVDCLRLYALRSIPVGLRDKDKAEVDSMLTLRGIESVKQPTKWCSEHSIASNFNSK